MTLRNYHPNTQSKKDNRTVYFKMRVTQEEEDLIRKRAEKFHGVSYYIRAAIAEYSNPRKKEVVDFIDDLSSFYFNDVLDISGYGDSLNDSVKRVNELAKAGKLTVNEIEHEALGNIKSLQKYLATVKSDLDALIEKAQKNGVLMK